MIERNVRYIFQTGALMRGITLVLGVVAIVAVHWASRVSMGVGADARATVYGRVQGFSAGEMNHFGTPSLITRNTNHGHDTDVDVADTPELLSLLLYLPEAIRPRAGHGTGPVKAGNVNRLARRLASTSAWLLPATYRWRYLAEYSAEMAELPRREHLAYAIRAASRTWPLRRALASPSRGPVWS